MELRKSIGRKIRASREALHLTQEKFAEMIGIDVSYLSYVENGKRNVGIDVLERINTALGRQIDLESEIISDTSEKITEREDYIKEIDEIIRKMDTETLKSLHRLLQTMVRK